MSVADDVVKLVELVRSKLTADEAELVINFFRHLLDHGPTAAHVVAKAVVNHVDGVHADPEMSAAFTPEVGAFLNALRTDPALKAAVAQAMEPPKEATPVADEEPLVP